MLKEILANILWYKELQEQELKTEASEELKNLKVVLGVDETWLEQMLLVCQDLTTNYIFCKLKRKKRCRKLVETDTGKSIELGNPSNRFGKR